METNNNNTLRLLILTVFTFLVFFIGMIVLAEIDFSTPMRIDLTQGKVFLREGLERNYLVNPENAPGGWVTLEGKNWRIQDAELPGQPKTSAFTVADLPVKYYTYLFEFNVSTEQMAYLRRNAVYPGVFLASISDNWEIYLNGNLVVRNMYLDENERITQHRGQVDASAPLNKNFLTDGKNIMMIHIAVSPNYRDAGLFNYGEYYIDEYQKIQTANNDIFLLMFSGISVFMGFYNFMIYVNNRKEKYYLHFAMIEFLLGIYVFANSHYPNLFLLNTRIQLLAEYMSLCIMPIFAVLFTKALAGEKLNKPIKLILFLQCAVAIAMPFGGMQFMLDLLFLAEIFMLFDLLYSLVISICFMRRGNYRTRSIQSFAFIGFLAVLVTAVLGVLSTVFFHRDQNQIIMGLFAFVISISFSLVNDVLETKYQIVHQNELLEERVAARTAELKEQTKLALAASETKSNFLATMSHEIRTPMNAIIGIAQIERKRSSLNEHTKEALDRIFKSAHELLGIINDILDLSKVTTGKLEIIPTEYELPSMINDAAQLNMVRIGAKPIAFHLSAAADLPVYLQGDELRIKQVINNILSNAIKYTDQGSVSLTVEILPSTGEQPKDTVMLQIRVADTGQGMKPEQLEKLFDEYSQFNLKANRLVEGSGLGMSITYKLVYLMGGSIAVESEFGKGSTFTVQVPQKTVPHSSVLGDQAAKQLSELTYVAKAHKEKDLTIEYMPYGRVLVVDDVETNLYVAEGLLEEYGVMQEQASSGYEALEAIEKGNVYDVIFMDHMMPKMDGIETVRRIRDLGYTAPIVALTANAIAGNAELFLQNGFDGFISKPIDVGQLHSYMLRFVRDKHLEEASEAEDKKYGEGNAAKRQPADLISSDQQLVNGGSPDKQSVNDGLSDQQLVNGGSPGQLSLRLWKAFSRDAKKAQQTLVQALKEQDDSLFILTIHGMKSACANIGRQELSSLAKDLEFAGREGRWEWVKEKAPIFLEQLENLLEEEERSKEEQEDNWATEDQSGHDRKRQKKVLRKNSEVILEACLAYDEMTANQALKELDKYTWNVEIQNKIDEISLLLLHAEFEAAADATQMLLNGF
jgi:signal transduction histidine kinase/DNA-binding NarL/FixJ family response regulator/HPt (histidine-containing phosphotransfer) domain-containing protein